MINITPVILCGGSGTRLWPLSRTGFPKQFLCLTGNESLFQQAALRLASLANPDIQVAPPIVVTGEDHRFLATEQLREVGVELGSALLEPVGRNTAPALTLAALAGMEGGADPVLVVTPSDQTVVNPAAFTAAMQQAVIEANNGTIVILGVTPDRPETAYGYIQINQAESDAAVHTVRRFVEKPDATTAQAYPNVSITDNVSFLGMCPHREIPGHIQSCKALIVPSFYESFGLPVIESLFFHKASLCSSGGALPEIGSAFAYYFDPHDQDTLIKLIEEVDTGKLVIDLPAEQVDQYLERFSWSKVANFYLNLYVASDFTRDRETVLL